MDHGNRRDSNIAAEEILVTGRFTCDNELITNTRTFGSDVDRVIACGEAYMRGADENGVAVSIKHFPGDGVDERDQHLGVSINSLSADEWMATYGKVYKTLIGKGAKTVMVVHIAQPAWVKRLNPNAAKEETLLPASVNPKLLTDLLRGELGFNGLISTDATPMIAFCTAMKRSQAIPAAIAAGADMILFNKSLDEDFGYLMEGIRSGIVWRLDLPPGIHRRSCSVWGWLSFFDAVSDGNNITHSKPHPEVFQKAAGMLSKDPSVCLVVEDAVSGVQAGHAAGMKVACVGDASQKKAGGYNLTSFSELLNIIGG